MLAVRYSPIMIYSIPSIYTPNKCYISLFMFLPVSFSRFSGKQRKKSTNDRREQDNKLHHFKLCIDKMTFLSTTSLTITYVRQKKLFCISLALQYVYKDSCGNALPIYSVCPCIKLCSKFIKRKKVEIMSYPKQYYV